MSVLQRPFTTQSYCLLLHAWLSLKVSTKTLGKTLYQTKDNLFSDCLRAELPTPRIPAFMSL